MSASTIPAGGAIGFGRVGSPLDAGSLGRAAGSACGRARGALISVHEEISAVRVAGPAWRLTDRGRRVIAVALGLLALALGLWVGAHSAAAQGMQGSRAATASSSVAVADRFATVRSGDTLWGIVSAAYPQADPREALMAVRSANGLREDAGVVAGQRIALPRI